MGDCHARFLLVWEPGVMLGSDGGDESYGHPFGEPLGPAVLDERAKTLTRVFSRNRTKVVYTYSDLESGAGMGVICSGGIMVRRLLVTE